MRGTCGLPGTWRTPITTCRGSLARKSVGDPCEVEMFEDNSTMYFEWFT